MAARRGYLHEDQHRNPPKMVSQHYDEAKVLLRPPFLWPATAAVDRFLNQLVTEIWVDQGCQETGRHFMTVRIRVREYVVVETIPVDGAGVPVGPDGPEGGRQMLPRFVPANSGYPFRCQVLVITTNPSDVPNGAPYAAWLRGRCAPEPDTSASFRFPALGSAWPIRSVLHALTGQQIVPVRLPLFHGGNLMYFLPTISGRGHRDLVSQWMIRLTAVGIFSINFDDHYLHESLPKIEELAPNRHLVEAVNCVFRWTDEGPPRWFPKVHKLFIKLGQFPDATRILIEYLMVEDPQMRYFDPYLIRSAPLPVVSKETHRAAAKPDASSDIAAVESSNGQDKAPTRPTVNTDKAAVGPDNNKTPTKPIAKSNKAAGKHKNKGKGPAKRR
ncbi:hypothetical protein RB599_009898 [Gaeumannomyces hyphopodioides]